MNTTITTYSALDEVVRHFQSGIYDILIIEGKPGTGKSQLVKKAFSQCGQTHCWLEGRTSAPAFYETLYQFQDCPIILDDADMFVQDKQCLNLLKTLCQTDHDKRVQWLTLRKLPEGMPSSFYTASTVLIITNQWRKLSIHMAAVQDRGVFVEFAPSFGEIHRLAQSLCDQEIWSFFGQYLHVITDLSLRQYVIAQRMYNQQIPWHKFVLGSWGLDTAQEIYLGVEADYPTLTEEDKIGKFLARGGKSVKAYHRVKSQLYGGMADA